MTNPFRLLTPTRDLVDIEVIWKVGRGCPANHGSWVLKDLPALATANTHQKGIKLI
jgi:hypothetical protein